MFKGYIKGKSNLKRVFVPFFMGFLQSLVAIVIEMMIILHLSTKNDFLGIIISYATLASVITFDDKVASAMFAHKVQDANGKKVKKTFFRGMIGYDTGKA